MRIIGDATFRVWVLQEFYAPTAQALAGYLKDNRPNKLPYLRRGFLVCHLSSLFLGKDLPQNERYAIVADLYHLSRKSLQPCGGIAGMGKCRRWVLFFIAISLAETTCAVSACQRSVVDFDNTVGTDSEGSVSGIHRMVITIVLFGLIVAGGFFHYILRESFKRFNYLVLKIRTR